MKSVSTHKVDENLEDLGQKQEDEPLEINFLVQLQEHQLELIKMADESDCVTQYTKEGWIILPHGVLVPKSYKKPTMIIMDFTTVQEKKNDTFSRML